MKSLFNAKFSMAVQGAACLLLTVCCSSPAAAQPGRIFLDNSVVLVHESEPSYVRRAASDLAAYLQEITGTPVSVVTSRKELVRPNAAIVVGERLAIR